MRDLRGTGLGVTRSMGLGVKGLGVMNCPNPQPRNPLTPYVLVLAIALMLPTAAVAEGQFHSNFGSIPVSGVSLLGNAGYNSGNVRLTSGGTALTDGAMRIEDLTPAESISGFSAHFRLNLASVSSNEGFSFNFGQVGRNGATGTSTGLAVSFNTNSRNVLIRYNGSPVGSASPPLTLGTNSFVDIDIEVVDGAITVRRDHSLLLSRTINNWSPASGWQFGFSARGRSAANHVDDVAIAVWTTDGRREEFGSQSPDVRLLGNASYGNGVARLTTLGTNLRGTLIFDALDATPVQSFRARFRLYIGDGSGADGMSFAFGDFGNAVFDEKGPAHAGLTVSFDTYNNGGGDVFDKIEVLYGGTTVANGVSSVRDLETSSFVDVVVQVSSDGRLTVVHDNRIDRSVALLSVPISGWSPGAGWRFGFGARTGGRVDNHWVDDVQLQTISCGDGNLEPGEQCDDGNLANGDCCSSTCTLNAAGAACGDLTNTECSAPDTCDGAGACLANHAASRTSCGDSTGSECTAPDTCDGAGTCLANHASSGTSCGDATDDECTAPDTCDGAGTCLANHVASGASCGDPSDTECTDPDTCDGSGFCLSHHAASGSACGDATETECSAADSCDGSGGCSTNDFVAGTGCGDPTDDGCSDPDTCDGSGACLDNHAAVDSRCGDSRDTDCSDPDTCDGSGTCRDNHILRGDDLWRPVRYGL